ncbi:L-histidine N(alpha)-methyltransferase [Aureliella helgolandensis]|uniref:Histidine-specific methyltransferase EgtD n=1 Tax=Aureliella helgolandensis TaxID=2527968 RepID=A0A518G1Y6_9BACT|nr:L-histidine N(alpha)-methyltransferase [Aureliella helgolandensis]QDV22618.1 Histidine-specific methyltransferase EgtD [Aureliella helgolandensis]
MQQIVEFVEGAFAIDTDCPIQEERQQFYSDVLLGLASPSKYISSKYLYDAQGSALFDQICEVEEYYPTRTERLIMSQYTSQMADCIGTQAVLVELGSGSSIKTRVLLDSLKQPRAYVPVDVSREHLLQTVEGLERDYPGLQVQPIVADFTQQFELPDSIAEENVTVFFPGSTIGNLSALDAQRLLHQLTKLQHRRLGLLIGFDLVKDVRVLEAAYNDAAAVSDAFTLNVLHRINRELGGSFDVKQFEHHAFFNPEFSRIEIYLVSLCEQSVQVGDRVFQLGEGERILTEYSHKYSVEQFSEMATTAGFEMQHVWTDSQDYFAVAYLEA